MTGERPDDVWRRQLREVDPARTTAPLGPRLDRIVEATMRTDPSMTTPPPRAATTPRRWLPMLGAAAAVAALAGGGLVWNLAGQEPQVEPSILALTAAAEDPMASCLAFSVDVLAEMSPAYGAVVVEVEGDTATLEVERTYAGDAVDLLLLTAAPPEQGALVGGITEYVVGERYLLTAEGGQVSSCGYSGPATPEFEAAYDEAFGS